jgi:hypothetical protein
MQSETADAIVLETINKWYKNQTSDELKRFHWWEAIRHQPQWRTRSDAPSTMDAFVSLSEAAIEEEVTRLIGWDKAKTTARKEKGNEDSSS